MESVIYPGESLQAAVDAASPGDTIRLYPGIYAEKARITTDGLRILGHGATLAYDDHALRDNMGTFRTPTLTVLGRGTIVEGLTIQNTAGDGRKAGQAVALHAAGDQSVFTECRLIAAQDTLFCGPTENPGDAAADGTRLFFRRCYIQGDVDFIFGSYCCWFEACALYANDRQMPTNGWYTAANTPEGQPYGFVFSHCKLSGACADGRQYLGRPWRKHAKTVFLRCEMDACVAPAGWADWDAERPVTEGYCEYGTTGSESDLSRRHPSARLLTPKEADAITIETVFRGWNPPEK